jgi:hypothetical protein
VFLKTGTLRAAIAVARDEKMVDGQDPIVVMNRCSEVQLDMQVAIDIEVRGGKGTLQVERDATCATREASLVEEWPLMLKMYVSMRSLPLKHDARVWPCYVFARRFRDEKEALRKFLGKLSDRRFNVVVTVVKEQAQ